jgi:hypothetical protein
MVFCVHHSLSRPGGNCSIHAHPTAPGSPPDAGEGTADLLNAIRYYWITAKGYRLRPWRSPYLRWRLETFFGPDAANLDARQFFGYLWRERKRMRLFLAWVKLERQRSRRDSNSAPRPGIKGCK